MAKQPPNRPNAQSRGRGEARRPTNPAEHARRELVEWCKVRGLPVPPERRG